jgi:hypothetical protein
LTKQICLNPIFLTQTIENKKVPKGRTQYNASIMSTKEIYILTAPTHPTHRNHERQQHDLQWYPKQPGTNQYLVLRLALNKKRTQTTLPHSVAAAALDSGRLVTKTNSQNAAAHLGTAMLRSRK